MNYLFDIDGTLTPPRQPMQKEFKKFFAGWIVEKRKRNSKVFLVTGSDRQKTVEQIGLSLWRFVDGSYQNCGNQLYIRGQLVKQSKWKISPYLRLDILTSIEKSPFYGDAKQNIEERAGMVNISAIGRGATEKQRQNYYRWDKESREREGIIKELYSKYPNLEFSIGGEISIDIYPKGKDKSQALSDMVGRTTFFGDKCKEGNDYHISRKSNKYYNVRSWEETYRILKRGGV